jgi:hypothetical protein
LKDLTAELELLGYNQQLEQIAEADQNPLTAEAIEGLNAGFVRVAAEREQTISALEPDLIALTQEHGGSAGILTVLKEQYHIADAMQHDVQSLKDCAVSLEETWQTAVGKEGRTAQDAIIAAAEAAKTRLSQGQARLDVLTNDLADRIEKEKPSLKTEFMQNPSRTLYVLAKEHPELAALSPSQLRYVEKSEYIRSEFAPLLKTNPAAFVGAVCSRADEAAKIAAKMVLSPKSFPSKNGATRRLPKMDLFAIRKLPTTSSRKW